jgi:hypothetical protein
VYGPDARRQEECWRRRSRPAHRPAHVPVRVDDRRGRGGAHLNRLRNQVPEQQAARTKATLGCAFDGWLKVHEVEDNAHEGYEAVVSGFHVTHVV